ncbi:MAG TPA: hypothetical protein P5132_01795 [Bacteroidales bacterium]|nr:hypothetical protein [Bacteroidales bacterium]
MQETWHFEITNVEFSKEEKIAKDFLIRIRYRQPLQEGALIAQSEGFYIQFEKPQRGIAHGQFAAWYHNDELIGFGVIA